MGNVFKHCIQQQEGDNLSCVFISSSESDNMDTNDADVEHNDQPDHEDPQWTWWSLVIDADFDVQSWYGDDEQWRTCKQPYVWMQYFIVQYV